MIVVSDTSSLFYAAKIGCEGLLHRLFNKVIIPPAVYEELAVQKHYFFIDNLLKEPWLKVEDVSDSDLIKNLLLEIDLGESQAITLSIQLSASYLLVDERRGTALAKKLKMTTVGLVGIFILAKKAKYIDAVKPWLNKLITEINFRYSKALINSALQLANEK